MTSETGLQELIDKDQIRTILNLYCRAVDRADAELLTSLYHPDAVDEHGEFSGTRDDFVIWGIETVTSLYETCQHSLGTVNIELAGDRAYTESYFVSAAVHRERVNGEQIVSYLHGRYLDWFERRDGVWRIARRRLVAAFRDVHPLPEAPLAFLRSTWGRADLVYDRPAVDVSV